jgi:hypothetical protein
MKTKRKLTTLRHYIPSYQLIYRFQRLLAYSTKSTKGDQQAKWVLDPSKEEAALARAGIVLEDTG